jgi:DNA-binding NtrC family response regulator
MEKQKILIIDDDQHIRKTLSDILKIKGYETFTAPNGTEGIDFLKRTPVKLVIIDLGLPDMSGLEVLSKVKAGNPFIEAIILTGNASLDSAIEATNMGAFSYLLKPYDMEQLLVHIRRAIEKQEARETIAHHNKELVEMNTQLSKSNRELANEILERKRAEAEKEKLIIELTESLAKIKTLSGLLPICAWCKKIRDDAGYWQQLESYIGKHSGAEFSHSICPECLKEKFGDFDK